MYCALFSYSVQVNSAAFSAENRVQFGSGIDGSSFVTAFDTLDGVELTGVWNKKASRIDF